MAFQIDKNKCPHNHRCPMMAYCPVKAITQKGFDLPLINLEKCIDCGKCVTVCPKHAVVKI